MSASRFIVCVLLATSARVNTTPLYETTSPVDDSLAPYETNQVSANSSPESVANSDPWTQFDFPNPQRDVNKCGNNGVKSWVCDPAQILTRQEGSLID